MTSKYRNFVFTWNNYTESDEAYLQELPYKYLVYGREVAPTTGTLHLQGAIHFKNQRSFNAVRKLFKGQHVEIARDFEASIEYCKKDGDYFERGDFTLATNKTEAAILKRKELYAKVMSSNLKDLASTGEIALNQVGPINKAKNIMLAELPPYIHLDYSMKRGLWYVGPAGTGKTRKAMENNPHAYLKEQNKWWDGYQGQDVVILDDLDTDVLGHYLKKWADVYPCSGEVKNGHVQLIYHTFIVTSNFTIQELFEKQEKMIEPILRRFDVTHFFNWP